MNKDVFKLQDKRYAVDGTALRSAREVIGLTIAQFAERCGWSTQYHWRIENNYYETLSEATASIIDSVLTQAG